jgi:hypothetical protein
MATHEISDSDLQSLVEVRDLVERIIGSRAMTSGMGLPGGGDVERLGAAVQKLVELKLAILPNPSPPCASASPQPIPDIMIERRSNHPVLAHMTTDRPDEDFIASVTATPVATYGAIYETGRNEYEAFGRLLMRRILQVRVCAPGAPTCILDVTAAHSPTPPRAPASRESMSRVSVPLTCSRCSILITDSLTAAFVNDGQITGVVCNKCQPSSMQAAIDRLNRAANAPPPDKRPLSERFRVGWNVRFTKETELFEVGDVVEVRGHDDGLVVVPRPGYLGSTTTVEPDCIEMIPLPAKSDE